MRIACYLGTAVAWICLTCSAAHGITAEELLKLKKAGMSDQTLQLLLQLELEKVRAQAVGPGRTMGERVVVDAEGRKRVIRYSIEDPVLLYKECLERQKLEESSWQLLRELIIDARRKDPGGE
jgi:hypothetical protein